MELFFILEVVQFTALHITSQYPTTLLTTSQYPTTLHCCPLHFTAVHSIALNCHCTSCTLQLTDLCIELPLH